MSSFFMWGSGSPVVQVGGDPDLAVLLFKFSDALADEVEDLAVAASALVFGDIVELVVKNGVDLDAEVLVFLVSLLIVALLVPFPDSDLSMSIFIFFDTIPNQDQDLAVRASSFIVSDHMELVQHGLVDADG